MEFFYINIVFIVLILLPNILLIFFPPLDFKEIKSNKILEILEKVGQIGVFLIPIFFKLNYNNYLFIILILFLFIYYIGWIRFYIKKRKFYLLFSPLYKIPIPLAISPILYFTTLAILLNSWVLFIFTVLLAIGHIPISYNTYKKIN